jgi:hypothetical protein
LHDKLSLNTGLSLPTVFVDRGAVRAVSNVAMSPIALAGKANCK